MTAENDSDENQINAPEGDWEKEVHEPIRADDAQISELLENERRRAVMALLREFGGESTIGDLAERVASLENDKPIEQLTSAERKRVYIGLYQAHLPKLDDAGLVSFDKNRGDVSLTEVGKSIFVKPPAQESNLTISNYSGTQALRFLNTALSLIVIVAGSTIVTTNGRYTKQLVYLTPVFILIILGSYLLEKRQIRRAAR